MVIFFLKILIIMYQTTVTGGKLPSNSRKLQCVLNYLERSRTIISNSMDVMWHQDIPDHSFMLGRTQPAHFFLNLIMSFLFKAIGSPSVSFFSLQFIPQIPKTFYLLSFSVWILLTVCSWCGSTCSSDLCIYFKLAAGFGAFIRLKFYLYGKIIDGFIL